jgi:hypothetical protein
MGNASDAPKAVVSSAVTRVISAFAVAPYAALLVPHPITKHAIRAS